MKQRRRRGLSRRHFLRGMGGATLALPWSPLLADDDIEYVAEALVAGIREQSGG